ncbi:hypothetical protein TRFO_37740 [Tritrichomonas foetus]|uniref:Uncharacterized protein n=1 Tax=Tritrichomonas foetus TaxID=1144522 RepID=A0A1J4JEQ8_9EUKA|nr:hypothetical protein TRFO_37738 [Tritrichomonas foetus]OHS96125.1 hypothetical protein TRFO_37740 [Tritrichomonas foetus]|eukprot:OHS96123.1 hypothetical protein TRFO_37738 [Tritrichomonas foetus]
MVFPHADGNAAVTNVFCPSGFLTPKISICSASHPSSLPILEPIRSAKHFLPRSAFPPYPEPNDKISRVSGKCVIYVFSGLHGHATFSTPSFNGTPTE